MTQLIDRKKSPITYPIDEIAADIPFFKENQEPKYPRQYKLANNIPVYVFDNEQLDLIHFLINVRVGVLHERQKHLAFFTYSLLKESSAHHSSRETVDLLDFYGVNYSVSETLDKTSIAFSVPKNNVADVLPMIFDFLMYPKYREENLKVSQQRKIKDLEYNSQKTNVRATQLLLHNYFGDAKTAGQFSTRENILAVTTQQMTDFHQQTFCAENLQLYMGGHIDATIENCLNDLFSSVPSGKQSMSIMDLPLLENSSSQVLETMPNCVQSSILLCRPMFGYTHADRVDFAILATVLGGYFGSRLMQNLREEHGYTYGVSAGSVYFGNQSLFMVDTDVNKNDTKAAVNACFEEIQKLIDEPMPAEELASVKNYLYGEQIRDVENTVSYMKRYAYWRYYGLDEHEFLNIIQHIRDIDASLIQKMAKKYFEYNNFTQIIVGDISEFQK